MKLRNGKEYIFKHKKIKKMMPGYVKQIVEYIKDDFARAGLKITEVDYKIVKYRQRQEVNEGKKMTLLKLIN